MVWVDSAIEEFIVLSVMFHKRKTLLQQKSHVVPRTNPRVFCNVAKV